MTLFQFETESDVIRAAWQAALADIDGPSDEGPLVVVTDHEVACPPGVGCVILLPVDRSSFDPRALSVRLSSSGFPLELRLACAMLVELVRQRRELQYASETRAHLAQEALRDPLTGVANRRAWDGELARLAGSPSSLALAIFDFDHFKQVNDAAGHLQGDHVLAEAASRMRASLRPHDFLARIGGDEFGLLLIGLTQLIAGEVIERVRRSVQGETGEPFTASVGWSWCDPASPGEQWAAADAALQGAKKSGGDRAEST